MLKKKSQSYWFILQNCSAETTQTMVRKLDNQEAAMLTADSRITPLQLRSWDQQVLPVVMPPGTPWLSFDRSSCKNIGARATLHLLDSHPQKEIPRYCFSSYLSPDLHVLIIYMCLSLAEPNSHSELDFGFPDSAV